LSKAKDALENRDRKLEMEKLEGKFIIEGDPILKSELNLSLLNVQKLHTGEYYIKKCEHTITKQGYKVTLETFKISSKAILKSLTTKVKQIQKAFGENVESEVEERHIKEYQLFRQWDVDIVFVKPKTVITGVGPGIGVTEVVVPSKRWTFDQYLGEWGGTQDELVDELMKIYQDENYEIRIEKRMYSAEDN